MYSVSFILQDARFKRLYKHVATRAGVAVDRVKLQMDGDVLDPDETAEERDDLFDRSDEGLSFQVDAFITAAP